MPILGLMSSDSLAATQSENARRKVFYQYPQGAFPLMGLLSLMDDGEEVDKTSFGWWEERYILPRTLTAVANAAGPFTNTAGADLTAAGWSQAVDTLLRIYVDDASLFSVRDLVWVRNANGTASSIKQVRAIVTDVNTSGADYLTVRLVEAVTNCLNDSTNLDLMVLMYGSASPEGDRSRSGQFKFPTELSNYTQIFRTPVGPFTRNALKMGQRFDSSGHYKKTAKDQAIRHMTAMEQTAFWGRRGTSTVTNDNGDSVPERKTGGLLWFLEQWELGTISNGAVFDYRPAGSSDLTATAWDADDDKRVLKINGTITEAQFDTLIERAFLRTGNSSFEKLFVCGRGLLSVFNTYARKASIKVTELNSKEDTYGMQLVRWESIHGTILFKSHPLFNENPSFKYTGFIVDLGSIEYHAFQDSDTELLKNRQNNDEDGRKDEWLTEMGLEFQYPERHLYVEGLQGITV